MRSHVSESETHATSFRTGWGDGQCSPRFSLFVIPVGNLLLAWSHHDLLRREYHFWVYILASRSRTLYVGMTNDLRFRISTHREGVPGSFTARYGIHRLVHFEHFRYVRNAIVREKELKKWTRAQKIALIEKENPTWEELLPPEIVAGIQEADSLRE